MSNVLKQHLSLLLLFLVGCAGSAKTPVQPNGSTANGSTEVRSESADLIIVLNVINGFGGQHRSGCIVTSREDRSYERSGGGWASISAATAHGQFHHISQTEAEGLRQYLKDERFWVLGPRKGEWIHGLRISLYVKDGDREKRVEETDMDLQTSAIAHIFRGVLDRVDRF